MAKKSSFLGQLAKGFVRSAVNQVGRDGGRVVSNRVYGDAHSVPIRSAGNMQYAQSSAQQLPQQPSQIRDFFSINIHNLAQYTNGKTGQTNVPLNYDLGLFNEAQIISFGGDNFNVTFKSNHNQLTPQFAAFINHCAASFGLDDEGKGVINDADYGAMSIGTFGRTYTKSANVSSPIMIHGLSSGVSVTFLGVPQGNVQFGIAQYATSQLATVPADAQVDTPTFGNYALWFLLIAGTCGIGGLIMALWGYFVTKKSTVSCYTMVSHDIVKSDMRYKKGYRVEGQYQTKQKIEIPADSLSPFMVEQQRQYGRIYMIIGAIVVVLNIVFMLIAKFTPSAQ